VESGTVAAYGAADLGGGYELLTALSELHPQYNFVGEFTNGVLDAAMVTKSPEEIKRIRSVGKRTMRVVAGTEEFLTSHRARNGYLVKKDGTRLTIGDVKRRIRQMLTDENLVDPDDGTIFAIGRDAGVPHSRGSDRDPLKLGQTIVYDIFPAEPGGGYYFDFTRTWCLGYAPEEVERAYDDVLATFKAVMKALKPGELTRTYQALTCQMLEARGHPTIGSSPATTSGYVHSLAHGVGLHIHESPSFSDVPGNDTRLEPGMVITIEPGIYYPERGYGVRIEDCVWLNPANMKFETLANYRKDLVLKVKK
jgi:Xaa-Pro aminopeptidase